VARRATLYAVVAVVVLALCLCDSHRDPWIMTYVMVLGTLDGCHVLPVCIHNSKGLRGAVHSIQ